MSLRYPNCMTGRRNAIGSTLNTTTNYSVYMTDCSVRVRDHLKLHFCKGKVN